VSYRAKTQRGILSWHENVPVDDIVSIIYRRDQLQDLIDLGTSSREVTNSGGAKHTYVVFPFNTGKEYVFYTYIHNEDYIEIFINDFQDNFYFDKDTMSFNIPPSDLLYQDGGRFYIKLTNKKYRVYEKQGKAYIIKGKKKISLKTLKELVI